jgi:hypothetical protein
MMMITNHPIGSRSHGQQVSCRRQCSLASTSSSQRFEISAAKLATQKFPLIWFCKTANSVLGKQDEPLKCQYLIANPKTQATWTHS